MNEAHLLDGYGMTPQLYSLLVTAFITGLGMMLYGIGLLLIRSPRSYVRVIVLISTSLAMIGSAFVFDAAYRWGLVAVAGAGAILSLIATFRTNGLGRILAFRPRYAGLAFLVSGVSVIGISTATADIEEDQFGERLLALEKASSDHPPMRLAETGVFSDAGFPIDVYTAEPRNHGELLRMEKEIMSSFDWNARLIRRHFADDKTNCHGWVFTGGEYWVLGRDVPHILSENGYFRTIYSRPGDLAIYRKGDEVSHTAVVRSTGAQTMVEGKWGWMGVFLHVAEESCYGMNITYYRTNRRNHILDGVSLRNSEAAYSARAPFAPPPNRNRNNAFPAR